MVLPIMGQESTTDTVQNWKLSRLEDVVGQHEKLLSSINEKMIYTQGGVAGIYAVLGIIGLFKLRLERSKA